MQILEYLTTFSRPEDLQHALIAGQARFQEAIGNVAEQCKRIDMDLENVWTMFDLEAISKDECLQRRA